jgi:exopolysaccharide biosynthesis polyprenyl glycosylphosphotransferase
MLGCLVLQVVVFTLIAFSEGLYRPNWKRRFPETAWILAKAMAWMTILTAAAVCIGGMSRSSLLLLLIGSVVEYVLLLGGKEHAVHAVERRDQPGAPPRNVLIVGAGPKGRRLAACLEADRRGGLALKGFLDSSIPAGRDILGRIEDLAVIAREQFIDEVWVTITYPYDLMRRVVNEAKQHQLDVKIVPDLFGCSPQPGSLDAIGGVPLLTLNEQRMPELGLFCKRCTDVAAAAAALAIAAPMMGLCAVLIRLDSPGPALYRAPRMGRKGRTFACYKFRTMRSNADRLKEQLRSINERQGATFKIANDPRVTRVGRWLRRYSLDELPQLWNVLLGDMSLVGPRPHPMDDFERYALGDLRRLDVAPGITGLWQITARGDPSFERNMALDLEYIEKWSVWLDFRILLRTLAVVVRGNGA